MSCFRSQRQHDNAPRFNFPKCKGKFPDEAIDKQAHDLHVLPDFSPALLRAGAVLLHAGNGDKISHFLEPVLKLADQLGRSSCYPCPAARVDPLQTDGKLPSRKPNQHASDQAN